ncbi:MAG TPA: molybdopterin-synthase adenylyltransferase MoeB [Gemmatimonadaceae bacterium]|jgi:adenylyltransferase/sulfurtransferase
MSITGDPELSADELQRYHRHLVLPDVGEEGQRRLKASSVLLVGAGGLGSPAALYLAAAGVGRIGVVDADAVELSNLQRQVLHDTRDVGRAKVESARDHLHALNPHVDIVAYHTRLTSRNALELLRDYDVVLDGTDNFQSRYLINDACVLLDKPNVYGSVIRFEGQASVFGTKNGPCYRCLFREPPPPGLVPNCSEGGVFGVLPGLIGMIQATETIKLLAGIGEPLIGRLLLVDALRMRFRTIELTRDPECRACGTGEITTLIDYDAFCGVSAPPAGEGDVGVAADEAPDEITPRALAARLRGGTAPAIVDVREPYEWAIARLPDARLVPLNSLPHAVHSLDPDSELVVYCHHGVRSEAAASWLRDRGFGHVRNLSGGIDRWSLEVDPSLRRY